MKKKNRFIRWLPFVCATLLLLGSSMTVFAVSRPTVTISQLEESFDLYIDSNNYPVGWKVSGKLNGYCMYKEGDFWRVVATKKKILCNPNSETGGYSIQATDGDAYIFTIDDTDSLICHGIGSIYVSADSLKTLYTTIDWVTTDDTVVFHRPLTVGEMAIPLTSTVQTQTKIIVPIAVCCLALLIGSIVLLPRLRLFLLR